MPKSTDFDESRLMEACKAVLAQKKPQIAKIAREYLVSRTTLTNRIKKAQQPPTYRESCKSVPESHQEKALTAWIVVFRCRPDRRKPKTWKCHIQMRHLRQEVH